jgi:hypothetical protein
MWRTRDVRKRSDKRATGLFETVFGETAAGGTAGGTGRPPKQDFHTVVNGMSYVLKTGCQWRMLPKDFPPWQTVSIPSTRTLLQFGKIARKRPPLATRSQQMQHRTPHFVQIHCPEPRPLASLLQDRLDTLELLPAHITRVTLSAHLWPSVSYALSVENT